MISQPIVVTYDGSVLRPEKPLKLKPDTRYTVVIQDLETETPSNQAFAKILNSAQDLGVPDLAAQHDHYLYGIDKSES